MIFAPPSGGGKNLFLPPPLGGAKIFFRPLADFFGFAPPTPENVVAPLFNSISLLFISLWFMTLKFIIA